MQQLCLRIEECRWVCEGGRLAEEGKLIVQPKKVRSKKFKRITTRLQVIWIGKKQLKYITTPTTNKSKHRLFTTRSAWRNESVKPLFKMQRIQSKKFLPISPNNFWMCHKFHVTAILQYAGSFARCGVQMYINIFCRDILHTSDYRCNIINTLVINLISSWKALFSKTSLTYLSRVYVTHYRRVLTKNSNS